MFIVNWSLIVIIFFFITIVNILQIENVKLNLFTDYLNAML